MYTKARAHSIRFPRGGRVVLTALGMAMNPLNKLRGFLVVVVGAQDIHEIL